MVKLTVRLYLLLSFMTSLGFAFISAFYVVFLMSSGLNLFEVSMINAVYYLSGFLFEIPTGVIADVYGRKKSYLISCFLLTLSFIIYVFSDSFWQFCIAEAVGAFGATCSSGAFQAWFKARLEYFKYEGIFTNVLARDYKYRSVTNMIGAPLGGFAAGFSYVLPWLIGALFFATCGLTAIFFMKEEYFERKKTDSVGQDIHNLKSKISLSFKYTRNNKVVRNIILITGVMSFSLQAANMQWQPLFIDFDVNETGLGFIFTGASVALFMVAHFVPHMLKWKKSEYAVILFLLSIIAVGVLLTPLMPLLSFAVLSFILHEAGRGGVAPILDGYLHANIPSDSEERATILSINSMMGLLMGILGLIISGLIAEYGSISAAWIASGLFLYIVTIFLKRRKE